ncbi:MAG: hypothetical protein HQ478_11780 [Chloroflexi bacterium]|nr:hypothetical protein [Chloroflexota bacterium]
MAADSPESGPWNFDFWLSSSETTASLKGLLDSDPRSASVLAGSVLDNLLGKLITAGLKNRLDGDKLGDPADLDYSTKCTSAREMGLIGERMLAELRALGRIRNEFAHNPMPDLDFDSADVAGAVERLRGPIQIAADKSVPGAGPGVQDALERALPLSVTGRRYWWSLAVLAAAGVLGARLHVAGRI